MPHYIRPRRPGATIFFTVALQQRGGDLLIRHVDALRDAVRVTRRERPFAVDAWVVLPDHMHCIWQLPEGDSDYSIRMGAIKARFSMALRRAGFTSALPETLPHGGVNPALRKGQVGIWQKRFWEHHIRNTADWQAHRHYCWMNPVKHGLVDAPQDWPYSSYLRDVARGDGP
ncbi:transposase [Tabrizicola sp. TH137]|uniref:REP-associated tyrosine transposase n=1 Tax=Tabrizicola sp. TH137 TaxID=2067452 RepID=UPI000C7BAC37|nr:transposase [Tabrizicola sp. TH137]PLL11111.1 transposase [Tabrizicola sp. TH137]